MYTFVFVIQKGYKVTFEQYGEIISDFDIKAKDLKDVKRIAQFHKRLDKKDKCKTFVRFMRVEKI